MHEVRKKSVIPVYGLCAAWVLYCVFLPLYRTWHFIALACVSAVVYTLLSLIFPGKTEYVKTLPEPETTGDDKVDALLREGETAVSELRRLGASIKDPSVSKKTTSIADVTQKIFKNLLDDRSDYQRTRRFADYHLPETIKLLHAYDRLAGSGSSDNFAGENIAGTLRRIDNVLDTILDSYERLFDSLFENQALDIETDIRVLESVLKREGLTGKDFQI